MFGMLPLQHCSAGGLRAARACSPAACVRAHAQRTSVRAGGDNHAEGADGQQPLQQQQRQEAAMRATGKALRIDRRGRHIFLCAGATKPKCCDSKASLESWDYLKKRIKELGLEQRVEGGPVWRTKADCLRVCANGPIAVVYPDQVYYHSCSPPVLDRIIEEHLQHGRVVEEFQINVVS